MARGFLSEARSDGVQRSDLVDLPARLLADQGKAYRFDFGDHQVWLPKSQVEFADGVVTMPEWLASERGLI